MKNGKKVAMLVIMLFILSIAAGCGGGSQETGGNAGDKADTINVGINV
jgi:hypothetical protein